MAISKVTTGGAHSPEGSGVFGTRGDQKQPAGTASDYVGEVSLRDKTESQFKSTYSGYMLYRPKSPDHAQVMASIMIKACNNPHIGYGQQLEGPDSRQGIFKYGPDTTVDINCDCSSLVSYCISQALGAKVNTNTQGLGNAMMGTGQFMSCFPVSQISYATNPPFNGDVLLKASSHVELVVAGNPREGKTDEIVAGTWSGDGAAIKGYRDAYGLVYDFVPRTAAPSADSEYYKSAPGLNAHSRYAWGRFSEIMKSMCNLPKGAPKKWYTSTEDGYLGGSTPAIGAVMCFVNRYDAIDPGLAYIVEGIGKDYLSVSYVDPRTEQFVFEKLTMHNGNWELDRDKDGTYEYTLQGFIYNPAVDTRISDTPSRNAFVENAKKHVGDSKSCASQFLESGDNTAWSAAFVCAVASESGNLLDVIIPKTTSCSSIGKIGVEKDMGQWFNGPALDGQPHPQLGDLALFRTRELSTYNKVTTNSIFDMIGKYLNISRYDSTDDENAKPVTLDKYAADQVGIVVDVANRVSETGSNENRATTFTVVMGDVNDRVVKKTYTTSSHTFSGLFRPFWGKVDGMFASMADQLYWGQGMGTLGNMFRQYAGLYTQQTSKEDLALRDIRYVRFGSQGMEPSISPTGLTLCAVNYTGMIANMYGAMAEVWTARMGNSMVMNLWQNDPNSAYQAGISGMDPTLSTGAIGNVDLSSIALDNSITTGGSIKVGKETITLTNTVKAIYSLLNSQINNPAGTLGIMANMFQESRFNPASVNQSDGGAGLCQWTNVGKATRANAMKTFCQTHGNKQSWENNIQGQIEFLFHEAATNIYDSGYTAKKITEALNKAKVVPNTKEGAGQAMRSFLDNFEMGGTTPGASQREIDEYTRRKAFSDALWTLFFGNR